MPRLWHPARQSLFVFRRMRVRIFLRLYMRVLFHVIPRGKYPNEVCLVLESASLQEAAYQQFPLREKRHFRNSFREFSFLI